MWAIECGQRLSAVMPLCPHAFARLYRGTVLSVKSYSGVSDTCPSQLSFVPSRSRQRPGLSSTLLRMATEELPPTAATTVTSADVESTSSTHANLLKKAMELKEKGNAFFRAKEYKKAIIRYSKIRACVDRADIHLLGYTRDCRYAGSRSQAASFSDEEKAELVRLDQTANGNIAQCGDYKKCREFCAKVIGSGDYKSHPNTDLLVKALARAAQAALLSNDLDACKEWVCKALDLDPKCGPARLTYKQLQEKYKAHNAQQRKQMAQAFHAA